MTYRPLVGIPGAPGSVATDDSQDDASIALLGATTAAMNLYVDPLVGLDTNPGTAALPFRTINAALAAVPCKIKHIITVNLVAGTYAEAINSPAFQLAGGVLIIQGSMILASGEVNRLCDAGKASALTLGTALAGWGINALQDKWVAITAGTGIGQTRKIRTNTADTITTTNTFSPVPDGTSHYEVRTPGAVLTGTFPADYRTPTIRLIGLMGSDYRSVCLYGLDLTVGELSLYGCEAFYASGCAFRKGAWITNCNGTTIGMRAYSDDAGTVVWDNHGVFISDSANTKFEIAYQGQFRVFNAVVKCGISSSSMYPYFSSLTMIPGGLTSGISFYDSTRIHNGSLNNLLMDGTSGIVLDKSHIAIAGVIQNCTSGISLTNGSTLTASGALSGAGNTGVAITASSSSYFNPSGQAITIAGAGGQYKAGNRPVGTVWADLTTYGPDDDGADQKLVRAVPANPGPWTIALGVALNGMLASGLVRVHDITAGAVLAEAAPAPGGGQFSVDYATGVITFNTAEQTHTVAIYYRPVSYTGARIG